MAKYEEFAQECLERFENWAKEETEAMDTFLVNCEDTYSHQFNSYGYEFKASVGNHTHDDEAEDYSELVAFLIQEYDKSLDNELKNL